jgi:DNA-binding transcriptional regulator PaaX
MKKLLKPKDILLLTLAGIGDLMQEVKDPLHTMSLAYKNMYGFVPRRYTRSNFIQMVGRSLKTGDIEKVEKDGKFYLRLTSAGRNKARRDFPLTRLTRKWNKRWIIVSFDISEKTKQVRDRFRDKLESIGLGMLQESVWITPLPIGKDIGEFIESIGLIREVFVMEVSSLIFGDSKAIARKVWHLDKLEEQCDGIQEEVDMINQLITNSRGRDMEQEAKLSSNAKLSSSYVYKLEQKKRSLMKRYLEIVVSIPALPAELLSLTLQKGLKLLKN